MHKMWWWLGTCAALQGAAAPVMAAQACSGKSPAHSVALLELYTSEGCDSCPPADQYVSGLRAAGVAPGQAVLLSLHVDYWNYIGWKDPYSRAAFTERQRWLSNLAGSHTIYTPEIFLAGRELRGGTSGWSASLPAAVRRINQTPAQADISIVLGQAGASGLPVEVKASAARGGTLYVALTESGVASQVTAGENRGRTLKHDFVVREWLAPVELGHDGKAALSRALSIPPGAVGRNLGISAFVQSERGEVLQAFSQGVCL
ncbi:MAG: DUF1223 domain-containing protein [Pseudomonadota bacterium]